MLITDTGETQLSPGMCSGFKAGTGNAHRLLNRTNEEVHCLEVGGERNTEDCVVYPDDDLQAVIFNGSWQFTHKDGSPY